MARFFPFARVAALCLTTAAVSGCSSLGYYGHSIDGQLELWRRTTSIERVLQDETTDQELKSKLRRVLEIRRFASAQLALPDNSSYTEYADLGRAFVIWNVFAAAEFSVEPRTWCYPIVGCVAYRGYFDHDKARRYAAGLARQGEDVYVGGVPAYSTLGWFDDPLPSTVMHYPEEELAGLIFHELAHQQVFAKGDTTFNESFATTVELEGVRRWLEHNGRKQAITQYRLRKRRNQAVVQMILRYRRRLQDIYSAQEDAPWKRARKQQLISEMKEEYRRMTTEWPGYRGYSQWFAQPVNNAQLVSVAAYHQLVPAFQRLLAQHDDDLARFYAAVQELADAEPAVRAQALASLQPSSEPAAADAR